MSRLVKVHQVTFNENGTQTSAWKKWIDAGYVEIIAPHATPGFSVLNIGGSRGGASIITVEGSPDGLAALINEART